MNNDKCLRKSNYHLLRRFAISIITNAVLLAALHIFSERALAAPETTQTVLFVCPHNAAKSIMAAAYFNEGARRQGLPLQGISAGTHPANSVSTAVVALLQENGIDVSAQKPRQVNNEELGRAARVISLGCEDLKSSMPTSTAFESWDNVPPPIKDVHASQDVIRSRVADLLSRLTRKDDDKVSTSEDKENQR